MQYLLVFLLLAGVSYGSALKTYVKTPDKSFTWKVLSQKNDFATIDLTSLSWRSPKEVRDPKWRHWLSVKTPKGKKSKTAFLLVYGGTRMDSAPKKLHPLVERLSEDFNAVGAVLYNVPNQPLFIHGDKKGKVEDAILAYGWRQYLSSKEEEWIAHLPMVKSVVRAMDVVQKHSAGIENFVVLGLSKRGWTTWLTAAVDKRVRAIVPIVIDLLNTHKSFKHHQKVYNGWSFVLKDYEENKITERIDAPAVKDLLKIVDPFYYRNSLEMPKFVVNAANDQFFVPDSSQFYFEDLKGEKLLRYIPNSGHHVENSDYIEPIVGFISWIFNGKKLPQLRTKRQGRKISYSFDLKPNSLKLWRSPVVAKRDFRFAKQYPKFSATSLKVKKSYSSALGKKGELFQAEFLEASFAANKGQLKLTSPVTIFKVTASPKKPKARK